MVDQPRVLSLLLMESDLPPAFSIAIGTHFYTLKAYSWRWAQPIGQKSQLSCKDFKHLIKFILSIVTMESKDYGQFLLNKSLFILIKTISYVGYWS